MTQQEIMIGDFVRDKDLPMVCGIVVARGSIPFGRKHKIEGYRVAVGVGRTEFIPADDCELVIAKKG